MTPDEDNESIGLLTEPVPAEKPRKEAPTVAPKPIVREEPVVSGKLQLLAVDVSEVEIAAGSQSSISVVAKSTEPSKKSVTLAVEKASFSAYPGEGAEWRAWCSVSGKKKEELFKQSTKFNVELEQNVPVPLLIEVEAPVGVRYKDRIDIRVTAAWKGEDLPSATLKLSWITRQALLAIKTFRGYEREVADSLATKAEDAPGTIFSLMVPSAMRGYVFVEGMSFEGVNDMLKGIRKARGLVKGETSLKEVEPLLEPKVTVEGFVEGAIVELVSGPFKGEKARVKRIDQEKEQITVELIEAVVPIPVTVRGDNVRMVEKGGGN